METLNFDLIDAAKLNNLRSRYDHLRHIAFPYLPDNSVHILLGVDAFWHIEKMEILDGPAGRLYGVRNLLGWTITGPLHQNFLEDQCNYLVNTFIDIKQHEDISLNKKCWKIEEFGTTSDVTKQFSSIMKLEFMK